MLVGYKGDIIIKVTCSLYTVDLQRDMHYTDFVVQASTIVHGLKTGNTSNIYN